MSDEELAREMLNALLLAAFRYPLLPGLVYTSPYDFVLQHGRSYTGKWAHKYKIGAQKMCFGNAIVLSGRFGLKYVEGFAIAPTGQVILHAWNEENGVLVDSTWGNTGLFYFGVEFSVERADDATWNGDTNILNDENRNYPVFQQQWKGEDYALVWPYSDRLESLRLDHHIVPSSVREYQKGFSNGS
jgi:hypothetical protein